MFLSSQLHSGDLGSLTGLVNLKDVNLRQICKQITGKELSSALLLRTSPK